MIVCVPGFVPSKEDILASTIDMALCLTGLQLEAERLRGFRFSASLFLIQQGNVEI